MVGAGCGEGQFISVCQESKEGKVVQDQNPLQNHAATAQLPYIRPHHLTVLPPPLLSRDGDQVNSTWNIQEHLKSIHSMSLMKTKVSCPSENVKSLSTYQRDPKSKQSQHFSKS
jgi:hypothetical protein